MHSMRIFQLVMTADRLSQIVFTCVVAVGGTASISSGWEAPFGSSGGFKCSAVSLAIHHHLAKRKPPIYHKLPFTAACIEFQICNFTAVVSSSSFLLLLLLLLLLILGTWSSSFWLFSTSSHWLFSFKAGFISLNGLKVATSITTPAIVLMIH
ncbi:hypothetical protein Tsp_08202 [Trichinella spiralis]|uniref:hypothetical protein n=1 Tax=Trichinella spiralis TaxID=6334 RepID=UPI0001EFE884|nr:hypothetical protein Tsp_08202 [Trichinella spiralis]